MPNKPLHSKPRTQFVEASFISKTKLEKMLSLCIPRWLIITAVLSVPTIASAVDIDFETDEFVGEGGTALVAGDIIGPDAAGPQPYADDGVIITVVPGVGGTGPLMIFDSANPTGGDSDIGSPNEACPGGGPGVGAGGAPGGPGPNCVAQGNVLIISQNGNSNVPNDSNGGGVITFEFTQSQAAIGSISFIDDVNGEFRSFDANDSLISTVPFVGLTENEFNAFPIGECASRVEVELDGSGAIPTLSFEPTTCTDLALTKDDGSLLYAAGNNVTYTLTVTNNGASDIPAGSTIADTLPPGATFVSTTGCAEGASGFPTCTLGAIAAGASTTVNFTINVPAGFTGDLTNTATVTPPSGTTETNTADNTDSDTNTAATLSDFFMTKSVTDANGDGIASPGEEITYVIVMTNTNGALLDIPFIDVFDPNLAFTGGVIGGATDFTVNALPSPANSNTLDMSIDFPASGVVTLTLDFDVASPLPAGLTEIANQAVLNTTVNSCPDGTSFIGVQPDINGNGVIETAAAPIGDDVNGDGFVDSLDCGPTVIPTPVELVVTKTVVDSDGDALAEAGDTLTYTISIENTLGLNADDVSITDLVNDPGIIVDPAQVLTIAGATGITPATPTIADLRNGITLDIATAVTATITYSVVVSTPIAANDISIENFVEVTDDGIDQCATTDQCSTFLPTDETPGTPTEFVCPAGTTQEVLDWDTVDWPAGSLTETFPIGFNSLTFTATATAAGASTFLNGTPDDLEIFSNVDSLGDGEQLHFETDEVSNFLLEIDLAQPGFVFFSFIDIDGTEEFSVTGISPTGGDVASFGQAVNPAFLEVISGFPLTIDPLTGANSDTDTGTDGTANIITTGSIIKIDMDGAPAIDNYFMSISDITVCNFPPPTPELTLDKQITGGDPYAAVGDVITYSFLVTNSGNTTLAGPVTINDDLTTDESCPDVSTVGNGDGNLDVGESITCTASYTVTQADIDNGSVTNTANATADGTTSNDDSETATANQNPELTLDKQITGGDPYAAVGDVITYSFLVTNSGNTTLAGPVTINDDLTTDESCPDVSTVGNGDGNLDVGESITCTASYTVTQADIDNGSVTNTANATADGTTSNDDSETATANQNPELTLDKQITGGDPYAAVGDVITYSFLVTNSGNTTLAGPVTINDDLTTDESCPDVSTVGNGDGNLDVGESITCTASYTVTQADIDNGSVTNTANATADGTTSNDDSETATANQNPELTLDKQITGGDPYAAVGDVITYSFLVTNSGNTTLAGPVTINDDLTTDESCPDVSTVGNGDGNLDVGESITCTASYTVTQADIDNGSVTNTANATADGTTSNDDSETATANQNPELTLDKQITGGDPYAAVGDVITYSFLVTNSGNTTLAGPVTINDDLTTDESCPDVSTVGNGDGNLDVGESITCTASYTVTQADIDNGSVTNTANATADGTTSNDDSETATANQNPELTLDKQITGGDPYAAVGDVITYSFLVTNSGNTTLAGPVTINDDLTTDESCPDVSTVGNGDGNLDVGESITCTASYTVTQADIDNGSVTNTANATADGTTSNDDSETATANQNPELTLDKQITGGDPYAAVGDVITYSFLVTNSGNTTLAGPVTINDDLTTDESCPDVSTVGNGDGNLDVGESITCTASYTVTQADIDNGSVTNTANATADGTTSNDDSETATANQNPELTLDKQITGGDPYAAVGDVITYSFLVTNSGNTTLAGPVTINDDLTTDESCPDVSTVGNGDGNLDVGESITCTASYTVTQADIDNGSVTNTANATADGTTSNDDSETATANQNPELTLDKQITGGDPYAAVGDVITYSFLVTNSGNTTLAGPVTINDDLTTDESCPDVSTVGNGDGNLDVGESITCTASYTVTQADIDNGSVTNTANATADGTTSNDDSETATANQNPELTLDKQITGGDPYAAVGDVITYSFLVTNSGNTTLAGPVTINDDLTTDESCPDVSTVGNGDGNLDVGESITCTASYTVTQADIDNGSVTNTANATADGTTSNDDSETATANQNPELTLDKQITGGDPYAAVGDVITYSFLVTNSGNTTLAGPVTINDDLTTDESCPDVSTVGNGDGNLDVGESITCTASYTVTQADIDNGSVTNTANATADGTTSNDDSETATANQNPELTLDKQITGGDPYAAVGDVITYSFLVTNSGNTTLAGPVTINDDLTTDESCPDVSTVGNGDGNLDVGESITCTASYTVTQADIDNGSVTNTANATADGTTSNDDSETATANQNPELTLDKQITGGDPYAAVGDVITYSFLVTNSGNTTLAGPVTINDDLTTDESCPDVSTVGNGDGNLDVGESITCTASYTVTQADIDNGSVTNTANATADGTTSNDDSETATANQNPELTLDKQITGGDPYAAVGDVITYSFLVTNSGNTTLAGPVTINDDLTTDESCPDVSTVGNGDGNLDVGESITCTASYTVTQADIDNGSVTNTANATADGTTSNDDSETATANQNPELTLDKQITGGDPYAAVGDVITYSFLVTNSGNTTLAGPVTINDDLTTDESCPDVSTVGNGDGNLDVGESITCTASYTVTQADIDNGSVTNTANATADGTTSNDDSETATANQNPELTLDKQITGGDPYAAVGDVITYSFLVTNSGNTTLAGPVTINDDLTTDESCPDVSTVGNGDGNLDVGESITCTASYTVTQADIDNGSVTNTANATADGTTSNDDSETATANQNPELTLDKQITGGDPYAAVGDVITYSFLVTNSGNTTLAGPVTINDDLTTDESCPDVSTVGNGDGNLDVGESITCTASYTVTQADIDNGSVTNTANATADGTTSNDDSETATANQNPELTLDKQITGGDPYAAVGDVITYSFLVTNSGNTTLAGPVTINDDLTTDESCPDVSTVGNGDGNLDVGESITCTASYTVTQADIDNGSVTNTANATADGTTSNDDSETANVAMVSLQARVMLQGALNVPGTFNFNSIMRDTLRQSDQAPGAIADFLVETEPYTNLGFAHVGPGGGETVTNPAVVFADRGNDSIVDWVFVELRSASNNALVVATRSGLVQRDGDVVDMDGVSPLTFRATSAADYFVSINHRNHLGVMTETTRALSAATAVVDFTDPSIGLFQLTPLFDGLEQFPVPNGGGPTPAIQALWAGDVAADGTVIFAGQNNDINELFDAIDQAPGNIFGITTFLLQGYQQSDVDMNGIGIFAGQNNDTDFVFDNVDQHPLNFFGVTTFLIIEQLP